MTCAFAPRRAFGLTFRRNSRLATAARNEFCPAPVAIRRHGCSRDRTLEYDPPSAHDVRHSEKILYMLAGPGKTYEKHSMRNKAIAVNVL